MGNDIIKLYHIEGMPHSIIYSIFISMDMTVSAYKGNCSIYLHNVIPSFDWKICLFSELDNIVYKVREFPIVDTLKSQCDDSDAIDIPIKAFANNINDKLK